MYSTNNDFLHSALTLFILRAILRVFSSLILTDEVVLHLLLVSGCNNSYCSLLGYELVWSGMWVHARVSEESTTSIFVA